MTAVALETAKRFVWWSTEKSVAEGVPSVLAALEVVVAVGAYWAIAIYFETATHLWVSICVAPLLLLRGEQSTALGARWFDDYVQRGDDIHKIATPALLTSVQIWGLIAAGLITSAAISYVLARGWLVGHEGWSLIWRRAVVGYVALTVAAAVAGAGAGPTGGAGGITIAITAAVATGVAAAVTVAAAVAGAGPGPETVTAAVVVAGAAAAGALAGRLLGAAAVAGATAGALIGAGAGVAIAVLVIAIIAITTWRGGATSLAVAGVAAGAGAETAAAVGTGPVAVALAVAGPVAAMAAVEAETGRGIFMPSSFLGIWLLTIPIRFAATARFLRSGFWNIPVNFRHTLFVVDLRHPAELIPGYSGSFPNSSTDFFQSEETDLLSRLSHWVGFVIFFVPAYLYRLSIKSTCWLYLPLVYIASERDLAVTPAHFVDRLIRGGWEWWRRMVAMLTLIAFAVMTYASISTQEFAKFLWHGAVSPKIISPLEFMFQFDFSGKWWQYCSLAGAIITGLLFLQAKEMRVDIRHARDAKAQATIARQFGRAKLMMRFRNVLSMALIAMIGVHALLTFSPIGLYLPAYILRGLGGFYGPYMPPIAGVP